ncbi:type VI secretion system baseplate subunit TssE [Azotobacter beijerinckii]|uniref:type VI secretion system baseplate subunit TssE n=1 Tax=Azotobacter beijerinckii TaxID=170623 RepID=UPI0029556A5C|nr:type VI secretion system baseplate subunit TssE [Azotobacter beijerinckii]MDV7214124.1 type VI secretion system baseplate subunit TssE [Azotobacter beijerinckii]
MPRLGLQEHLQPSLLDRLTDEAPDSPGERPEQWAMTQSQLKASVLRDLAWLFNATAPLDESAARMPAGRSVLNYGLPPLAGHSASNIDVQAVEKLLIDTIEVFEPRILRGSLQVRARLDAGEMSHNALSFEIEGDLWALPVPLRLLLTTRLDLESGHVRVAPAEAPRRPA